jgi:hypothetical protein
MKKYRAVFLAGIAALYAVTAIAFPDQLLPDAEIFATIFDAIANVFDSVPEPTVVRDNLIGVPQ